MCGGRLPFERATRSCLPRHLPGGGLSIIPKKKGGLELSHQAPAIPSASSGWVQVFVFDFNLLFHPLLFVSRAKPVKLSCLSRAFSGGCRSRLTTATGWCFFLSVWDVASYSSRSPPGSPWLGQPWAGAASHTLSGQFYLSLPKMLLLVSWTFPSLGFAAWAYIFSGQSNCSSTESFIHMAL